MRGALLACLLVAACGGDDGQATAVATGGAASTGGTPGTGGEVASGGVSSGGVVGSGGVASSTGGALASTGGVTGTGGSATASGGAPTVVDGGPDEEPTSDAGPDGEVDAGSASGGAPGTGGTAATGGVAATGGAGTGGVAATGGAQATGGVPACECATGPCCDGCHFRPDTYACLGVPQNGTQDTPYSTECNALLPITCDSGREGIIEQMKKQWCTGRSAQCDGRTYPISERWRDCPSGTSCRVVGTGLTAAQCAPCGN